MTSTQFSEFWTPSPLVYILIRSIRLNPRNLPYYVCISLTPPLPPPCRRHLSMAPYRSRVSVAAGNRRRPAAISGGNRNARSVGSNSEVGTRMEWRKLRYNLFDAAIRMQQARGNRRIGDGWRDDRIESDFDRLNVASPFCFLLDGPTPLSSLRVH